MFLYKVICNFVRLGRKHVPSLLGLDDGFSPIITQLSSERAKPRILNMEEAPKKLWHSLKEWTIGLACGAKLLKLDNNDITAAIAMLNNKIQCDLIGSEIYAFYSRRAGGKIDTSVVAAKLRAGTPASPNRIFNTLMALFPDLRTLSKHLKVRKNL